MELNIFSTIRDVTSRTEPFHSRFLANALCSSLSGDRSLFEGFWKLAEPGDWPVPQEAAVCAERDVGGGRKIDLTITDCRQGLVLGIEVKTERASATSGQLEAYASGLVESLGKRHDWKVAIAFLTPFNRERAVKVAEELPAARSREEAVAMAERLATVRLYARFAQNTPYAAQHVSWLDVADLPWDGRDIWRQHQAYVRNSISSEDELKNALAAAGNRTFEDFFGADAAGEFWGAFSELDIDSEGAGADIDLRDCKADPEAFTRAFHVLMEQGEGISRNSRSRSDQFPEALRERFLDSRWYAFHEGLFELSIRYPWVWISGTNDYGVRVAHKLYAGGVSLVTSSGPRFLKIGKPR